MPDDELARVTPTVLTTADPPPKVLLAARAVVQNAPEVQALFRQAREQGWAPTRLALALEDPLQGLLDYDDVQEVVQVAQYLADEYDQIGDALLLISSETGRAIGRLSESDVFLPAPVPRENSTQLAQPLPRLNPQLESFLVHWHFERGREQKVSTELAARLHQTALLQQEGDPRLLVVSRKGREQIVDQVRERLPSLLTEAASGTMGQFLRHFDLREDPPYGTAYELVGDVDLVARHVVGIQDLKAANLRYPRVGNICAKVVAEWGREIAQALSAEALQHLRPAPVSYLHVPADELSVPEFWVADPDTAECLASQMLSRRVPTLAVPNAGTLGFVLPKIGALVVSPTSYACAGRELFDRWEVGATVKVTLWVDWTAIRAFLFGDIPTTIAAELVR